MSPMTFWKSIPFESTYVQFEYRNKIPLPKILNIKSNQK